MTEETNEPTCIHGVSADERCMDCWPEEPDDILPQLEIGPRGPHEDEQSRD